MHLEEALEASKFRQAYSEKRDLTFSNGVTMEACVVFPRNGHPYWVPAGSPGRKVGKASTADVKACRDWKPW